MFACKTVFLLTFGGRDWYTALQRKVDGRCAPSQRLAVVGDSPDGIQLCVSHLQRVCADLLPARALTVCTSRVTQNQKWIRCLCRLCWVRAALLQETAYPFQRSSYFKESTALRRCSLSVLVYQAFTASSTATATATVAPTMGLLPMPRKPIISTCAGTELEPANCASECIRPIVSVMP